MDDFMMIRFALDNVHPPSIGEGARAAFDRVLNGEAMGDRDTRDGRSYARLRANRAGRIHGGNDWYPRDVAEGRRASARQ